MSNQRFHAYSPTRGASQSQRGGSAHSPNRRTPGASPRYPSSVYHGSHQHPLQHLTHQSPHPLHNQDSYAGVHSNYGHGFAYGDAGAAASIGHSTLHSQDPNFQIGESASCQFAAELRRKAPPGTWALNLTSVLDDAERKTITDLLSDVKKSLSPSLKCDLNSVSHDIQSCYCQKIQSCVSYPHRLLEAIDELHDLQRRLKIELGELQASHRSLLVDQHYLNTASSDASARPISAALIATHKETVQVCEENIQGSRATNDLLLTMIEAIRNIVRDGCDFANCHEMVKALANGQGVHLYNQPTASNLALLYKLPLASVFASDLSRLMSKSSNGSAEELITMLQELHQKHLPFLADDDKMDHSCAKIVISKLIEFFSFNYSVWDAIVKFGKHRGTIPLEFSKPVPYKWHGSIDIRWNRLYLRVLLCDESNRMLLPPPVEKAINDNSHTPTQNRSGPYSRQGTPVASGLSQYGRRGLSYGDITPIMTNHQQRPQEDHLHHVQSVPHQQAHRAFNDDASYPASQDGLSFASLGSASVAGSHDIHDAKSKDDAGMECASGPGDNASQAPVTKEDVKEDSHPNSLSGAESNYAEIEHERDDLQVNKDKVHDALPSMREAVDNQESDKEEDEEGAKIAASSDDANPDFDTNAIATSNLEDPAVEENILDTASESDKPSSQEVGDLEPTEAVVMKNVDFSELTYRELQAVCKEQGLSAKGSTEQLLQRLIEAVNATKSSNDQDEETAPAAKPVIDKEEEQDNENTSDEYSQFTVIELRESCTRIGLPKGGNKEELRQRLLQSKEAASKFHAETEEKDEHDANEQDDDKKVDDDSVGDDLSRASYRDLQKMCMDRGMKAGGKRDVLLNLLKESSDEAIQEEPSDDEIETEAMVLQAIIEKAEREVKPKKKKEMPQRSKIKKLPPPPSPEGKVIPQGGFISRTARKLLDILSPPPKKKASELIDLSNIDDDDEEEDTNSVATPTVPTNIDLAPPNSRGVSVLSHGISPGDQSVVSILSTFDKAAVKPHRPKTRKRTRNAGAGLLPKPPLPSKKAKKEEDSIVQEDSTPEATKRKKSRSVASKSPARSTRSTRSTRSRSSNK